MGFDSGISRLILVGSLFFVLGTASELFAHTVFKKELQKKYPGLTIKCEVCHVKGEDKTVVNDFGKLFVKELEEHDLIEKWKALEGDEKQEFEAETMAPVFNKAFETIKVQENKDGKIWHDIFDAGEMENTKLKRGKTKGTEGLEEEKQAGDDESADGDKDKGDKDKGDKDKGDKDKGDGKEEAGKDEKEGGKKEGGKDESDKKKDDGQKDGEQKEGGGTKGDGKKQDGGKDGEEQDSGSARGVSRVGLEDRAIANWGRQRDTLVG